jgi:hypothetical protein
VQRRRRSITVAYQVLIDASSGLPAEDGLGNKSGSKGSLIVLGVSHVAKSEPAGSYYGHMSLLALKRWICRSRFMCLCSRGIELRSAL